MWFFFFSFIALGGPFCCSFRLFVVICLALYDHPYSILIILFPQYLALNIIYSNAIELTFN